MPFILYVYLLLFIKLFVETFKGNNITQEGIYSQYNLSQIILKSMI